MILQGKPCHFDRKFALNAINKLLADRYKLQYLHVQIVLPNTDFVSCENAILIFDWVFVTFKSISKVKKLSKNAINSFLGSSSIKTCCWIFSTINKLSFFWGAIWYKSAIFPKINGIFIKNHDNLQRMNFSYSYNRKTYHVWAKID